MPTLEQNLQALAERGTPRGPDALIDRIERELVAPGSTEVLARQPAAKRPRSGLAVAVAAAAVIIAAVLIGSLVAGLVGESEPPATTSVTTTSVAPDPSDVGALFDGTIFHDGDVLGEYRDGEFFTLSSGECCIDAAFADTIGGVVFQRSDGEIVRTVSPGETAPVVVPEPGEQLSLEGVGLIGGEPSMVLARREGSPEAGRAAVETIGLDDGAGSVIFAIEAADGVLDRVSYADGRYLLSLSDQRGSWFEFRDATGDVLPVAANPRPEPAGSIVRQGVLQPDGAVMVYIDRSEEAAGGGLADLVVYDLERGIELSRNRIAQFGDRIVAIDADRVVVSRIGATQSGPRVVVAAHLAEEILLEWGGVTTGGFEDN